MKPAARIQAVLDLLGQIEESSTPADVITNQFFRTRRYIGSKDRAEISKYFWDFMRHKARLNWHLQNVQYSKSIRSAFIVYLALVAEKTFAEIAPLFSGDKYCPSKLTNADIGLLELIAKTPLNAPEMPDGVRLEIPDWAVSHLIDRFEDDLDEEVLAFQKSAPLDLRVNLVKARQEEVLQQLSHEGWKIEKMPYAVAGVRLKNRPNVAAHPLFKSGAIEVQDEGSQLIAEVAAPKEGQQVIDFCAGAGGKTLALAAMMNNKGRIVAGDVHPGRLRRAKDRLKRAGIHNVETRVWLETGDKWRKRHKGKFDIVLVDAPCSGSGTWRRNPDAKWSGSSEMLHELVEKQHDILNKAAKLVAPGGKLVYATCSVFNVENDKQAETFLKENTDFTAQAVALDIADKETGYLKLTPHQHNTDGFFTAVFTKAAAE